jgi:hypothetical protein
LLLVDGGGYRVCDYVHLNPVRAGLLDGQETTLAIKSVEERLNLCSVKSASARLHEWTRTHSQDSKNEPC